MQFSTIALLLKSVIERLFIRRAGSAKSRGIFFVLFRQDFSGDALPHQFYWFFLLFLFLL